ncbi:MAG: YjdF family protein [Gemella morbillorum]|uniref:YjdF family protein n=1 Tax=Gemella morbillorum TaxID=29391 RepID=UPI001CB4B413|nr:YjdF family protein [Gemella morbillorum]MBF1208969.1 YjdF family protein [Gemella morbillorum]
MEKIAGKLTVFFDNPFWVGVFECVEKNKLSVCRVVFGAEPKDYEVYDFILKNYKNLKFGSSLEVKVKKIKNNPKRLQREVKKQSKQVGIGTKSQLVLQKQREEMKLERKKESKQIRELENRRKFELKQEKRKQKHRGK